MFVMTMVYNYFFDCSAKLINNLLEKIYWRK